MSLVLPMTAWLIQFELNPEADIYHDNGVTKHCELLPDVQTGRKMMYLDFERRWVTDLDESILEDYTVATMLDPRWKNWDFEGSSLFLRNSLTRDKAVKYLRAAWKADWKPAANARAVSHAHVSSAPVKARGASEHFGESRFLKKKSGIEDVGPALIDRDQLDVYLSLPQEANSDVFDVMSWWNQKGEELPDLYRMARQFLGCPATTGGVERVFSAAGRMHDDFKKSTGEDTLEHMLRVKNAA